MADIKLTQGKPLPLETVTTYKDMGDGTHALQVFDGSTAGGFPGAFTTLTVGDVAGGNYAEFDTNGFLFFYGDGRAWIDYNFGIGRLGLGASAPDRINMNATTIKVLAFNGVNITEEVSADIELNHNWTEGTMIIPHVHWMPTTAGAGNVNWQVEYTLTPDGTVAGASSTTINTIIATPGVAWQQERTNLPTITTPTLLIGTQASFRFFRDPTDNDTYGADAAIRTFGLHVILNSLGSRQVGVK
jgi:hypothetical protein